MLLDLGSGRDSWDMSWLSRSPGIDLDHACALRELKAMDYVEVDMRGERLSTIGEKLDAAFAPSAITSSTFTPSTFTPSAFSKEMSRFLPSSIISAPLNAPSDWKPPASNWICSLPWTHRMLSLERVTLAVRNPNN